MWRSHAGTQARKSIKKLARIQRQRERTQSYLPSARRSNARDSLKKRLNLKRLEQQLAVRWRPRRQDNAGLARDEHRADLTTRARLRFCMHSESVDRGHIHVKHEDICDALTVRRLRESQCSVTRINNIVTCRAQRFREHGAEKRMIFCNDNTQTSRRLDLH